MSIEMMRFGELFDEGAAAPGGGAGGARRRRADGGGGCMRGRKARVRPAASFPLDPVYAPFAQVRVGPVHVELPVREQPTHLPRSVRVRVGCRRALVPLHLHPATRVVRCVTPLDRQFSEVIRGDVSSGCVILYFTDRQVGAVSCRCDIKAAACNK